MTEHQHPLTGRLTSVAAVREFSFAGKAIITLVSEKTGTRFTYKIKQSDNPNLYFVALLNGPDNESDYAYLGLLRNGVYEHGRKSQIGLDAPSAKAFLYFGAALSSDTLPAQLQVWHEGRCGRCARKLTVPASVERGIGPECAGRL